MNVNEKNTEAILIELRAKLSYRKIKFTEQCAQIDRLEETLKVMKTSTSWRVTKPLRKLVEVFRGK